MHTKYSVEKTLVQTVPMLLNYKKKDIEAMEMDLESSLGPIH